MSKGHEKLASSTLWLTLAQLAPLAVNIALTPFVILQLGETRYGLWLIASSVAMFFGQFDGGIYRTALRYFSGHVARGDAREAGNLMLSLSIPVVGIQLVTLAPLLVLDRQIAGFFQTPEALVGETTYLLRVVTVVVGVGLLRGIFAAILHSHMKFGLTAGATLVSYVGYAAAMFLTLRADAGLRGVALAYIIQTAIATVVIVPSALRLVSLRGARLISGAEARGFARMAWRVQAAGLLNVLSAQGLLLLVGRLRPAEVASFGPGATFAQNFRSLPTNALGPIQARLGGSVAADGDDGTAAVANRIQRTWVRAVVGLAAVGAPAAYVGINAWLPLEGSLSGAVAAILVVAHLLALLPQVQLQWAVAVGRADVEVKSTATSVALLFGLSVALIPVLGSFGVGVAAVLGSAAGMLVVHLLLRGQDGGVRSPLRDVPVLAGIAAVVVTVLVELGLRRVAADMTILESGAPALLWAGVGALPGLVLYAAMTGFVTEARAAFASRRVADAARRS